MKEEKEILEHFAGVVSILIPYKLCNIILPLKSEIKMVNGSGHCILVMKLIVFLCFIISLP